MLDGDALAHLVNQLEASDVLDLFARARADVAESVAWSAWKSRRREGPALLRVLDGQTAIPAS